MPYRKVPLVTNELYHVYNKSIAGFEIFNKDVDCERMLEELLLYSLETPPYRFSVLSQLTEQSKQDIISNFTRIDKLVDIVAYCLMPTHFHLILKQLKENGISILLKRIQQSYTQYFNLQHKRKGPLWEGRFKSVHVESDDQFLHLTRYIHLNPVTAELKNKPEDWKFSSYKEYIGTCPDDQKICSFSDYFDMGAKQYMKYVNDRIDYQRKLAKIKKLILE